jgi:hypothetical protein
MLYGMQTKLVIALLIALVSLAIMVFLVITFSARSDYLADLTVEPPMPLSTTPIPVPDLSMSMRPELDPLWIEGQLALQSGQDKNILKPNLMVYCKKPGLYPRNIRNTPTSSDEFKVGLSIAITHKSMPKQADAKTFKATVPRGECKDAEGPPIWALADQFQQPIEVEVKPEDLITISTITNVGSTVITGTTTYVARAPGTLSKVIPKPLGEK